MQKQIIFSGIQPSGNLHIGNYLGAIKQWVELQNKTDSTHSTSNELIFFIVDLHAITVPQDPVVLKEKILEVAALYIACGIDPAKSKIFIQSENPDHTYLAWLLDCIASFGMLTRMTQFKDKSIKQDEGTTVGLFNYPVLMAADILLYDTDLVPVGQDQTQHVELTRDLAEKFNSTFQPVFKLPQTMINKETARVMSLQNPLSKMSKSDKDPAGTINLLDSPEEIRKKVKRAVTDSGSDITYSEDRPAFINLITIYSYFSGKTAQKIIEMYKGKGYADFKNDLAEVIVQRLQPIQEKYRAIRENKNYLTQILDQGRDYAISKSSVKLHQVKEAVGLGR